MVELGLSPLDAIQAGTIGSAANMDLGHKVGTISAGMLADLLLVDGEPYTDIADLRNVVAVI